MNSEIVTANLATTLMVVYSACLVARSFLVIASRMAFGIIAVVARMWTGARSKAVSETALVVMRELGKDTRFSSVGLTAAGLLDAVARPKKPPASD